MKNQKDVYILVERQDYGAQRIIHAYVESELAQTECEFLNKAQAILNPYDPIDYVVIVVEVRKSDALLAIERRD